MPVTGKTRAPHRRCTVPSKKFTHLSSKDANELNCKQVPLSVRRAKTTSPKVSVQKPNDVTNIVRSSHSEDEFPAPLRIQIQVKAPKTIKTATPPNTPRSIVDKIQLTKSTGKATGKTALQQGNEDKWILHSMLTNDARIQSLAPYQYNSIEQRKDSKPRSRQKPSTNVTLTPTCTSSPKHDDRSKSADSAASRKSKSHDTGIPSNNPYVMMQGIPARRKESPALVGEDEISADTQQLLDHYKKIMSECFHRPPSPGPSVIDKKQSHTKAYTMKGDGSIVCSDFYIPKDGCENEADKMTVGGSRYRKGSGIWPRESQKRKQKGGETESCLSVANMLDIMKEDNYRYETFDQAYASCRQPQIREPLVEMPEKRWKVKNPTSGNQNTGKPMAVGVGSEKYSTAESTWAYSDAYSTYSEVLSSINDVKGVDPYTAYARPGSECRCDKPAETAVPFPRPLSSPPAIAKTHISVWGNKTSKKGTEKNSDTVKHNDEAAKKSVISRSPSDKKISEKCAKSRSTSEISREKHAEIIARIERSNSTGKFKRPSSPRVAESKSLYDYRTVMI